MNKQKLLIYSVSAGVVALGITVTTAPVTAHSKGSPAEMTEARTQREAKNRIVTAAWEPVRIAMASGDVAATRAAVVTFAGGGFPLYDWTRADLARFYIAHVANAEARSQLEIVVLGDEEKSGVPDNRPRDHDPVDYALWLTDAKDAPQSVRDRALKLWYAGHLQHYRSGAFAGMGPRALLEYEIGQEYTGNKRTRPEALAHFKAAFALAPESLDAAKHLLTELRRSHYHQAAKEVAIKAARLVTDPREKFRIYSMAGVRKEDLKSSTP